MPVTDGWLNVFRRSAEDPVPHSNSDLQAVGRLLGGTGPAAWLTTTVDDALAAMDRSGTERALLTVCADEDELPPDAPRPAALSIGRAAYQQAPDRFRLVLQLLDVRAPHRTAELVRAHGSLDEVVAVGVFPAALRCDLNDRKLYPVYEACIGAGLPVRINLGVAGPMAPSKHQHPELLESVLLDLPELTVIGCHMGHPYEALLIQLMMKFSKLYLLTSAYLPKYFDPAIVRFMDSSRGVGRIFFGSDHPGIPLERAIAEAQELPISPQALDQFLGTALCHVVGWP
jgi:predicted TIM-barrel fold metal-dependent hydrolase